MVEKKPKRLMKNFLLDKRFQLKYTLAVVVISTAISVLLGTFLYQAHRETSQVSSLDDPDLDGALAAELASEDRKVLFSLAGFLGALVLALGTLGIMATHKIAGPAYAMRRNLSIVADGGIPRMRALRKGDELVSVAEAMINMCDSLRAREELDLERIKAAMQAMKDGKSEEAQKPLQEMAEEKEKRIA